MLRACRRLVGRQDLPLQREATHVHFPLHIPSIPRLTSETSVASFSSTCSHPSIQLQEYMEQLDCTMGCGTKAPYRVTSGPLCAYIRYKGGLHGCSSQATSTASLMSLASKRHHSIYGVGIRPADRCCGFGISLERSS